MNAPRKTIVQAISLNFTCVFLGSYLGRELSSDNPMIGLAAMAGLAIVGGLFSGSLLSARAMDRVFEAEKSAKMEVDRATKAAEVKVGQSEHDMASLLADIGQKTSGVIAIKDKLTSASALAEGHRDVLGSRIGQFCADGLIPAEACTALKAGMDNLRAASAAVDVTAKRLVEAIEAFATLKDDRPGSKS